MKWKHKLMGWEAETPRFGRYNESRDSVYFKYHSTTVHLPLEIIQSDSNWEQIPDNRWLEEFSLTPRQFMEWYAMVIDESGCSHDSFVMKHRIKQLIEKQYKNLENFILLCD